MHVWEFLKIEQIWIAYIFCLVIHLWIAISFGKKEWKAYLVNENIPLWSLTVFIRLLKKGTMIQPVSTNFVRVRTNIFNHAWLLMDYFVIDWSLATCTLRARTAWIDVRLPNCGSLYGGICCFFYATYWW